MKSPMGYCTSAPLFTHATPSLLRRQAASALVIKLLCLLLLTFSAAFLRAQANGSGEIQGTITDPSGASIPRATVTATNLATGVSTVRKTSRDGVYSLNPLQPGEYNVEVMAPGFQRLLQEHVTVDALQNLALNVKMTVGSDTQTITVSDAPPMLETNDASIGGTIENEMYSELPLSMGSAPRDPTAFQFLMPGVQEGSGRGVFGGSGQENLNEVYLDGVPVTNITAQGDSGPISAAVSVDAVDQFQVKTNGGGVGFGGVGVTNYTIKTGGNKLHGSVFDYVRNTLFDSWGYFSKVPSANGYARKPGEHQNSYGVSLGGPILKDKFFFFGTYEGFHYTKISNTPQYITVPTLRERTGDFTELYGTATPSLYDPTIAQSGTRNSPFQGLLNGLPTYNVVDSSKFSSVSAYLAQALPAPTNGATQNNYLAGLPLENEDYRLDSRLDYSISGRHQISLTGVGGANGYGHQPNYKTQQQLPFPYAVGNFMNARTASAVFTYTYVASQATVNSFKYGFTRNWGPGFAPSDNTKFTAAKAGIGNLPKGNASNVMPNVQFGYNTATNAAAPFSWAGSGDTGGGGTNTFTIIDNLTFVRGRHNATLGFQYQWLETNGNTYGTYSNSLELDFNASDTECLGACTNVVGNAYASFLVGAVYRGRVEAQSITTIGGRYRPFAPYVNDNWRVNSRLTLDLGLRWDYLQPYHEVLNRIAFLDGSKINPAVGIPGVLAYAGHGAGPNPLYSPYICQCDTPVRSHVNNLEPRFGATFSLDKKTVLRGGFGIMTTHAGGVGGRAGATVGTGTSEFAATSVWAQNGSTGAPAFYLNPGLQGRPDSQNPADGNASIPTWTVPGDNLNPLGTAGNYNPAAGNPYGCTLAGDGSGACAPQPLNYADPNYGGRGPQFMNWNFGVQRMINKAAVLSINYAGSQTHFLANGGNRGYALNEVSPDYLIPLNSLLQSTAKASASQVAMVIPGYHLPYQGFTGPNATVLKSLSPFPQFLNNADLWGQTGNSNYNSLQVSIVQRPWHGISGMFNYTWSKSIDDTHGHRSQFPIGPQHGNFTKFYPSDRVDRGLGTYDQRNAFNTTFVLRSPFGAGGYGASHFVVRQVAGGWSLSGIYKRRAGTPLQITNGSPCNSGSNGGQGTCLPDYAPGFDARNARVNGSYGHAPGSNASNIQRVQYLNPAAFQCPDNAPCNTANGSWKIGNISKSAPDGLTGPGWWDVDLGIRRSFQLHESAGWKLKMDVSADVINVTNSTFFNLANGSSAWGNCPVGATLATCTFLAYGTVGGQNNSVPPRDWQFSGRFTF